jgi:hypothetical protein
VALVAHGVALAGVLYAGAGFRNGDAAAYAAQAWAGDLGDRPIHAGYILVAMALSFGGWERLPLALDALTALAAGVAVVAVSARVEGPGKVVTALLLGVAVLPECAFAEVDVVWFALLALAVAVNGPFRAAALAAAAVLVSPTAIAACGWVVVERLRKERPEGVAWVPVAVACTVSALLGGTQTEWWSGDRGVGTFTPDPLLTWSSWLRQADVLGPAALLGVLALIPEAARKRWPAVLATAPLLLAPADVPAWLVPAAALAVAAGEAANTREDLRRVWLVLLVPYTLVGLAALDRAHDRIAADSALAAHVAAEMQPTDGLVAPWSWGVRASVQATRDAYELRWRVPGEPVRNQEWQFCQGLTGRVAVLPPGERLPGAGDGEPDASGVRWYPAEEARRIYCEG